MRRLTTEEFIEKSREKHGSKYDYSHVIYKNAVINVEVICPEHGIFNPLPMHHMKGTECPKCAVKKINKNKRFTQEEFLDRVKGIPNLSFEKTVYKNRRDSVIVTCRMHGDYTVTAGNLLKGSKCKKCTSMKLMKDRMSTTEEFIRKAKLIHNGYYDYYFVDYQGSFEEVGIICPEHYIFLQTPNTHLKGSGCPKCKLSKGELKVESILIDLEIKFTKQRTFNGCYYERPLKFDFYLPSYNVCIEFDGKQHFKAVEGFWGGKEGFEKRKLKDSIKTLYCEQNSISLLRIKYNETRVKQKIKQFLNIN